MFLPLLYTFFLSVVSSVKGNVAVSSDAGTYDIGNLAALTGTFTNQQGAQADPSSVVMRYKKPNGTILTATPTKSSAGIYSYLLALDIAGTYYFRFEGTGALVAAGDGSLIVTDSPTLTY